MKWKNNILLDLKHQYIELLSAKFNRAESEQFLNILIENFFNISKIQLALEPDKRLNESEIIELHFAVKELLVDKPIQYITGVSNFHGIDIKVNESVLIPRPETEELVSLILSNESNKELKAIDIGTGSGCIALALKKKLRNAEITAIDVSLKALETAKLNSRLNGLDITFIQLDILKIDLYNLPLYDIVVSNPPYVTHSDKKLMNRNVVDFEPHQALFVEDRSPLKYYIAILNFCQQYLKNKGSIYFEINESQGNNILKLFKKYDFKNGQLFKDIHGKHRFALAYKDSNSLIIHPETS